MKTFKVHVLVKDERGHEEDVLVKAENSIEASKQAIQSFADKGETAYTISVWGQKQE